MTPIIDIYIYILLYNCVIQASLAKVEEFKNNELAENEAKKQELTDTELKLVVGHTQPIECMTMCVYYTGTES